MGKFNPAGADRDAFSKLFTDVDELNTGVAALERAVAGILADLAGTYAPLDAEVMEARGGYPSLDARLDDMGGGGGGTTNYSDLTNKPQINGVELEGNKTLESLDIASKTAFDVAISGLDSDVDDLYSQADKNIFRPEAKSKTVSGVTFTVNADGTVKANGTATAAISFVLGQAYVEGHDYLVLSGCPSNVSGISLSVEDTSGTTIATDEGEGIDFWVPSGAVLVKVVLSITSGTAISNKTISPMICMYEKWASGHTYAPQRMGIPSLSDVLDDYIYDKAGRNVLDLTGAKSQTIGGVTFVVNEDFSITLSGTATETVFFNVPVKIPAGEYIFKGMTEDGDTGSYRQELRASAGGAVYKVSSSVGGTEIEVLNVWNGYYDIRIANGYTFAAPVTVYPMIIRKSDYAVNSKYAPATTPLRTAVAEIIDNGAKNLIDLSDIATQTINGITWTVDAEAGTVTANGTATSDSFFFVLPRDSDVPYDYPTVLSGCPAGGSQSSYELQAQISSSSYRDIGSRAFIPAGTIRYIACCVRKNKTANNMVFQPMLCSEVAWGISQKFVPYRPSLDELWAAVKALQQGGA